MTGQQETEPATRAANMTAKCDKTHSRSRDVSEDTSSSGSSDAESDVDATILEQADMTSSSGSSNEDDESEHSPGTNRLTTIPAPSSDIHNRLASFFSQLAEQRTEPGGQAEGVIEAESSDSGYEEEDDKQYIELDLALGVLSENPEHKGSDVQLPPREGDSASSLEVGTQTGLDELKTISSSSRKRERLKRKIEEVG